MLIILQVKNYYTRRKDSKHINNINMFMICHPWKKMKRSFTFWFFPTKETKVTTSLSLCKRGWKYSDQVMWTHKSHVAKARKLNSCFKVNYHTKFERQHAIVCITVTVLILNVMITALEKFPRKCLDELFTKTIEIENRVY